MPTNDFVPYATAGGANVEAQATYVADGDRTHGAVSGVARSDLNNKALRQGTFWASTIAQFIVNQLAANCLDDGNVATHVTQFQDAILQLCATIGTKTGSYMMWSTSVAPAGYLECNGSFQDPATFPALFGVIGYSYGQSGSLFKLPDGRGYFMRGWDHGAGVDPGRAFPSTQVDALANHNHTYTWVDTNSGSGHPGHGSGNIQTGNTGNTGGSETRPKNIVMMLCIKT